MSIQLKDSFTGTGNSQEVSIIGHFNVQVTGFGVATLLLQRKLPDEDSFVTVEVIDEDVSKKAYEPEYRVLYRFVCQAHSSGTINYRISK